MFKKCEEEDAKKHVEQGGTIYVVDDLYYGWKLVGLDMEADGLNKADFSIPWDNFWRGGEYFTALKEG